MDHVCHTLLPYVVKRVIDRLLVREALKAYPLTCGMTKL